MMKNRCPKTKLCTCLFALIAVSFYFITGVYATDPTNGVQQGGNVVTLQKGDSGREIDLKSGDVIQIELTGRGGTGYWWYVTNIDPKYAELVSEETKPNPDTKLLGGPTKGIWRFKIREQGKSELVMKYYRVWEGPEKAADQFAVTFTIH